MKRTLDLATIRQFGNLELLARQLVEGFITGLHQSPYHGFSVEFSEHRLYNSGESTRHIDWKVFARTDRLYTKRYEEETNLRCHILMDVSPSMYYPVDNLGKLTFSVMSAAALATLLQKQRDAVGLITFSDQIELQTQVKSTGSHVHTLLLHLQQLLNSEPPQRQTDVASIIHLIAQGIPKRSLVVLFTDMFNRTADTTALLSALQHLKHQKHEVLLFHVMDKKTEESFEFEERPYLFQDLETGETIKLQPSQVKQQYHAAIEEFKKELALKCGQYGIDFVPVDINDSFDKVLLSYLIRRNKLR